MGGLIGGLIGGVGSAVGGIEEAGAAQTAANAQQAITQQDIQGLQALLNSYNQEYAPQIPTAASAIGAEGAGAGQQANQLASLFQSAGIDPAIISAITGVNANQLAQEATGYLSNPSGTQVGQAGPNIVQQLLNPNTTLAGVTPGLESYYSAEQQQGINPIYAENAQSQLNQQAEQQKSDVLSKLRPGEDPNALLQQIDNSQLQASANLGGQLAGESQQFSDIGAQGVASTASSLDAQKIQGLLDALQSAGVIDSQAATNLYNSVVLGSGTNQTQLANIGQSENSSQNVIDQLMNFINSGRNTLLPGLSQVGTLGQQFGQTATGLGNAAGQAFGNAASGIGSFLSGLGSNKASVTPSPAPTYGAPDPNAGNPLYAGMP